MRVPTVVWFIVLFGFGALIALSVEICFKTADRTPPGLDPYQRDDLEIRALGKMERLKGPIGSFWLEHRRLPKGFDELLQFGAIESHDRIDPFWHSIRWEEEAGGLNLRSAGWDRVSGTADDITLFIPLAPVF